MDVEQRYNSLSARIEQVMHRLRAEVDKLALADIHLQPPDSAAYRLEKDPASGEYSLIGEWRDARGNKQGNLLFHADGSFFVEYDIVQPHPKKPRWFIEAITAWGRNDTIKAEARLLPMPMPE